MTASVTKLPERRLVGPDVGTAEGMRDLAVRDPRLAVAVLGGCGRDGRLVSRVLPASDGSCDGGGWDTLNLVVRLQSGAADQWVGAQVEGIIERDLWWRSVVVTARRPNAFIGSILKEQSDQFFKSNPYIDFTLVVKSYCRHVIAPRPTPLENISQQFECVCPIGLVLSCQSLIAANMHSRMAITGQYVPTEVVVTFHGTRLPASYGACSAEAAVVALTEADLYPRGLAVQKAG